MSNAESTPRAVAAPGEQRGRQRAEAVARAAGPGNGRRPQRAVEPPLSRPRFARLQQRGVLDGAGRCTEHIEVRCPVCMYSSPLAPEDREEASCAGSAVRAAAVRLRPFECDALQRSAEDPRQLDAPHGERVAEVMCRDALCVTVDVDVDSLAQALLQRGITSAPVVDGEGRALGYVSMTDLVRDRHDNGDAGELDHALPRWLAEAAGMQLTRTVRTVGDVMSSPAISVTAYTSVVRAAAVMADAGVRQLAVTALDGRTIGVISAVDVLRWIAQHHGFAVRPAPRAREEQPPRQSA